MNRPLRDVHIRDVHIRDLDIRRPLAPIPSIKLKLGFIIAVAVAVTVFVFWVGIKIGVWPSVSGVIAALVAMVMVRYLSRGMTSPLREMAAAADAMAKGDYSRRVTDTSRDEVGALARAFNGMAAELAETDRMRRDLVANVSHELRTPITALQAQLENLVDGVADPDPETLLHDARPGRAPRPPGQAAPRPLAARVRRGAARAVGVRGRATARARGARAEAARNPTSASQSASSPPTSPPAGDPERVHQVVAEPPRERRPLHAARRHGGGAGAPARTDGVTIEVLDEGPGIPESEQTRVFERFYRADAARASSDGGAGLGLAIARWIVDLHGGQIHPEPRDPHGCRMVVTLPRN